jgi:hypothetical protein
MNLPNRLFVSTFVAGYLMGFHAWSGSWTEVASLNVPRQYPGLARLPDGRILAVTGHPLFGRSLDSAEIYDSVLNTWTPTGSLNVARNGVSPEGLIILSDGRILIAGGGTAARSANEVELFDPSTYTWSLTFPMNEARCNHTTTLLADGRVLVTGGIDWSTDTVLSSAELYDPKTATWILAGPMSTTRTNHAAVRLSDGRVLVSGGTRMSDFAGELADAEIFDPATGKFEPTGPMQEGRRAFAMTLLPDGNVLAIGGAGGAPGAVNAQLDSAEIFKPDEGTWTRVGSLIEARWGPDAILLRSGRVLVSGGMHGRVGRRKSAEIFDPASRSFMSAGTMHHARNGHRSIMLDDGRVLIVGGFSGDSELVSCEVYEE